MPEESTTTEDAGVEAAGPSTTRLMREALWLALILVAVAVLDALGRRGVVPGGGYLSPLLLLVLGSAYWARFRIRLPLSRSWVGGAVFTYVFLGALVTITVIMACVPSPWVGRGASVPQMLHLIVLVPLAEELYFRGVLLDHLRRGLGAAPAVILCSLLFGLMHVPAGTWYQAGLLSVIACLLVLESGSVIYAIQLHVTWNAVSQFTRIPDMDLRLICAAFASAFLCALAIAARMGSAKGDSVTRPT